MARIPNKLHFVWVGTALPDKYALNLLEWRFCNPQYEVYLWTESKLFSSNAFAILRTAREEGEAHQVVGTEIVDDKSGVKLVITKEDKTTLVIFMYSIGVIPPLSDVAILQEELTAWKNYGAASDILRMAIVHAFGGIYMDFDTYIENRQPLPLDIEAPYGILMLENSQGELLLAILASVVQSYHVYILAKRHSESYFLEYQKVGAGVVKVTSAMRERMAKVKELREKLSSAEVQEEEQSIALENQFRDYFVEPTLQRFAGTQFDIHGFGNLKEHVFYSFQRQSGYYPRIESEGSWEK